MLVFSIAATVGLFALGSGPAAAQTTSSVRCSAPTTTVPAHQPLVLSATGGNGAYTWSSPGLTISNPHGSQFTVNFNKPGTYPVTVASGNTTSTCNITVTAAVSGSTTTTTSVPGLPNTGELPK